VHAILKQKHKRKIVQFIRGLHNLKSIQQGCIATIGNFDGLHRGHQYVLKQLVTQAQHQQLPTVVIIFEPTPQEYFLEDKAPARLSRLREKLAFLAMHSIDYVVCLRFNAALANLTAEAFITQILVEKLQIRWLIIGDDFRFGYGRQGDFSLLERYGKQFNFQVVKMESKLDGPVRISSTLIREALSQGDFSQVKNWLGRPFQLSGQVIHGDKRGRQLGFPTANIALQRRNLPISGVYAVKVHGLAEKPLPAVANIGYRPTIGGKRALLEVHLFNFNHDIYGLQLDVEFLYKLRGEQRFNSLDELKAQIERDVEAAKHLLILA
jgi:riboflavin kinase/FMN adenylyltransferase